MMKKLALIFIFILLPVVANASTLSDAANSLSAGQSIKISTSNWTTLNLQDANRVSMWGHTAVWDKDNETISFIGKRDSASYGHHWFIYTTSTGAWTEGTLPSALTANQSGHAYDGDALDPTTGDIYFRRYGASSDGIIYKYDKSAGTWSGLTAYTGRVRVAGAAEWWTGRGLVISDNYGVHIFNGTSWVESVADGPLNGLIGYHSWGEYQAHADVYVFGGGNDGPKEVYKVNTSDTLTHMTDSPIDLGENETGPQGLIVADPSSDKLVAWDHTDAWYTFDAVTDTWSSAISECTGTGATACNGTPNMDSTSPLAVPISTYGVIAFIPSSENAIWLYKLTDSSAGTNSGSVLQSFDLTSSQTNSTTPFTVGLGFKKGDTTSPTLDLTEYQCEIKKSWNDGSVKHAICSGYYSSTADTAKTINVYSGGTQPSGTDLAESDIVTAAPTATVAFSGQSWTTVSLANLLGSPDRTFIAGPEMVEAHYSQDVAEQSDIAVKFFVRYYSNGETKIRVAIENGIMDGSDGVDYSYTPTVVVGSTTVYSSAITHENNSRWSTYGWISVTDPELTIQQDTSYLKESELVPNYHFSTTDTTFLNGLLQTYTPMDNGDMSDNFPGTGAGSHIGILPNWDALYISSGGDYRAYNYMIADTESLNSYPIIWRDPSTDAPALPSDFPDTTLCSLSGSGCGQKTAGSFTLDRSHHPSMGYLAYLVTGDYYYLEELEYAGAFLYLGIDKSNGLGTSKVLVGQDRAIGWINRTIGQIAGIAPSGTAATDFAALVSTQANHWKTESEASGISPIGFIYSYQAGQNPNPYGTDGTLAPWMQNYWVQSFGYVSDLEPLSSMTNFDAVRDYLYKIPVGLLGVVGTDNFCFTKASNYTIRVTGIQSSDPVDFYSTWGLVYYNTFGSNNTSCGSTLEGSSSSAPSAAEQGYWGYLMPAIAYAVEDGATGASDAWNRLTGATNYSDIEAAGFESIPIFGIYPRSVGTPASGGSSTLGGNSHFNNIGSGGSTISF